MNEENQYEPDQDPGDHCAGLVPILPTDSPPHAPRHRTQDDRPQQDFTLPFPCGSGLGAGCRGSEIVLSLDGCHEVGGHPVALTFLKRSSQRETTVAGPTTAGKGAVQIHRRLAVSAQDR